MKYEVWSMIYVFCKSVRQGASEAQNLRNRRTSSCVDWRWFDCVWMVLEMGSVMLNVVVVSWEPLSASWELTFVAFFASVYSVVTGEMARGSEASGANLADVFTAFSQGQASVGGDWFTLRELWFFGRRYRGTLLELVVISDVCGGGGGGGVLEAFGVFGTICWVFLRHSVMMIGVLAVRWDWHWNGDCT